MKLKPILKKSKRNKFLVRFLMMLFSIVTLVTAVSVVTAAEEYTVSDLQGWAVLPDDSSQIKDQFIEKWYSIYQVDYPDWLFYKDIDPAMAFLENIRDGFDPELSSYKEYYVGRGCYKILIERLDNKISSDGGECDFFVDVTYKNPNDFTGASTQSYIEIRFRFINLRASYTTTLTFRADSLGSDGFSSANYRVVHSTQGVKYDFSILFANDIDIMFGAINNTDYDVNQLTMANIVRILSAFYPPDQLTDILCFPSTYAHGADIGNSFGYGKGFTAGQDVGFDAGYTEGYYIGHGVGLENAESMRDGLKKMVFAIFEAPYRFFVTWLDVEIFGLNLTTIMLSIIGIAIMAFVTKLVLKAFL